MHRVAARIYRVHIPAQSTSVHASPLTESICTLLYIHVETLLSSYLRGYDTTAELEFIHLKERKCNGIRLRIYVHPPSWRSAQLCMRATDPFRFHEALSRTSTSPDALRPSGWVSTSTRRRTQKESEESLRWPPLGRWATRQPPSGLLENFYSSFFVGPEGTPPGRRTWGPFSDTPLSPIHRKTNGEAGIASCDVWVHIDIADVLREAVRVHAQRP